MTPPVYDVPPGAAPECNTFGVPVVTAPWGGPAQISWQAKGPLVPWQVSGVEDLWVPIDHTAAERLRFLVEGPDPRAVVDAQHQAGHLVVVSGRRRSGKTTFLHLVIHDLAQRLEGQMGGGRLPGDTGDEPWTVRIANPTPHVKILPVAGIGNDDSGIGRDSGDPVSVRTVNRRILSKIRDTLGPALEGEAGADLDSDDLYAAYTSVSRALMSMKCALILLLPDFRWNDDGLTRRFYRSCHDNAMSGIVFFIESSSDRAETNLTDELGDLAYTHATHLRVGDLKDTDWRDFIESRHRAVGIPGAPVRIGTDVLDAGPEEWMRKSIGKLQETLHEVTRRAHADRKAEIDAATLRRYIAMREQPGWFRRPRDDREGPRE